MNDNSMRKPRNDEYWIVSIDGRGREVVQAFARTGSKTVTHVYPCGDEQGWSVATTQIEWIRKVRL